MTLHGKIVIITGSSRGLGKALAQELIREEAKVIINARSETELKKAAEDLGADFFVADVAKEQEVSNLADYVMSTYGTLDIWINNAGITQQHTPITEIDTNRTHELMEVNLFGTMYGSRQAMRVMDGKYGVILNIISKSSLVGRPLSAGYASSKWAARGFTESLKLALAGTTITVIAVHPGGIKTDIFGEHMPKDYNDFMEPSFVAQKIIDNLKQEQPVTEQNV